jgi:Zn-dependent peptidase ImmA (M78 family)
MAHPLRQGIHLRQEAEANTFAIELLAPAKLIQKQLSRPADLEHVLAIADNQKISREAAARRYTELHHESLAVVFSMNGWVRYAEKGEGFPGTRI